MAMKISNWAFIILLTLSISCKEEVDSVCSVRNPIQDLPWLAADIQQINQSGFLSQYFYLEWTIHESKQVFAFLNCSPSGYFLVPVYDCAGNSIGTIGYEEDDIPPSVFDNGIIIWRADNFACSI